MTWWDNAETGRAARYEDPAEYDQRPTRAQCDQDEREITASRNYPTSDTARDIIADLIASVQAAKTARAAK